MLPVSVNSQGLVGAHRQLVWISSVVVSSVAVFGHQFLAEPVFAGVLGLLGLIHVLIVASDVSKGWVGVAASQSMIVLATLAAVFLHVFDLLGVPPSAGETLLSFAQGSLEDPDTFFGFLWFSLIFLALLLVILGAFKVLSSRFRFTTALLLRSSLAGSAALISIDYSVYRSFVHVSGPSAAEQFFFAAGIFGVEFSLPLFLLILLVFLAWRPEGQASHGDTRERSSH